MNTVYVEGYELDLTEDIAIPMNLQVIDVTDTDARVSEFTKTIEVKGTKNNNRIFGNLFNLQQENEPSVVNILQNFQPNRKANAIIIPQAGIGEIQGYIQVRDISVVNDEITYSIIFYGKFSDFISRIKGKTMAELNMDDLTHDLTLANVQASWNQTQDYLYPYIDYGNANIRSHRHIRISNLLPAINLKRYIDQIFEDAEFSYESDFIADNTQFDNLYIPYNGDNDFSLDEDLIEARSVVASHSDPTGQLNLYSINGNTESTAFNDNYKADNNLIVNNRLNTTTFEYITPVDGKYNFNGSFITQLVANYYQVGGSDRQDDPNLQNTLRFREHYVRLRVVVEDSGGNDVTGSRPFVSKNVFIVDRSNEDNKFQFNDFDYFNIGNPLLATTQETTRGEAVNQVMTGFDQGIEIIGYDLQEGDRVKVEFDWYSDRTDSNRVEPVGFGGSWDSAQGDRMQARLLINPESYFEIEPNTDILPNEEITYEQFALVDVDQADFFLSVMKMFNLIAITDENKPNQLNIRQRDTYFEEGQIKDITNLIDYSQQRNISPVIDPDIEEYVFSWDEGSDLYSERYKDLTNEEYGQIIIPNTSEFGTQKKRNTQIFEPSVFAQYENSSVRGILITRGSAWFGNQWEAVNSEELTQLTGIGQTVRMVINGVIHETTITDLTDTSFTTKALISAPRGEQFGALFINTYDRIQLVSYKSSEDNNKIQEPIRTNPKLVYYSGLKTSQEYTLTDGIAPVTLTQYPFIHHLNNHPNSNPTFDYNWGQPQRVFFSIENYPTANLYNTYHKKSVDEILNGSNMVELYVNLPLSTIFNLKYNDKLYIDGQLYRINRVRDFNLNQSQPVRLELYKLIQ